MIEKVPMIHQVDIHITINNLKRYSAFNQTDPFCEIFALDPTNGEEIFIGRTELIMNTQNPNFSTLIRSDYFFETRQKMVLKVYHATKPEYYEQESGRDLLGYAQFDLSDIVTNPKNSISLYKKGKITSATANLTVEVVADTNNLFCVQFSCDQLPNRAGFFGVSDPFLEIYRKTENNTLSSVYKSPTIMNTLQPAWNQVKIPLNLLCNNDLLRPLVLKVWDFKSSGKHNLMGETHFSLQEIFTSAFPSNNNFSDKDHPIYTTKSSKTLDLYEIKSSGGAAAPDMKKVGSISFNNFYIERHSTLTEYLKNGLQISLCVGIDFSTASGKPSSPHSFHYQHQDGTLNPYEIALSSVLNVLVPYDHDKNIWCLGFGAKKIVPQLSSTSSSTEYDFNLAGCLDDTLKEINDPFEEISGGTDACLTAYRNVTKYYTPSGGARFSPIIRKVIERVKKELTTPGELRYFVLLLLLTSAQIEDFAATKNAIVEASHLPISIIIVGLGGVEYESMKELDGDERIVTSTDGEKAERDIVQFLSLSKEAMKGSEYVTKEVLSELPEQIVEYFEKFNI